MERYISKTFASNELHERAKQFLPSGVSYIIRYFEPYPFYTKMAKRNKLIDVDGNEYVDFWIGHLALILGHSPEPVIEYHLHLIENGVFFLPTKTGGLCSSHSKEDLEKFSEKLKVTLEKSDKLLADYSFGFFKVN